MRSMNVRRFVACTVGVACSQLVSCGIVGVDHKRPHFPTPDAWSVSLKQDMGKKRSSIETWWKHFNDPVLNDLVARTRRHNPDLKIASQRVAEARALRKIADTQLKPTVVGAGDIARNRTSDTLISGASPKNPFTLYDGGFDASWEIDVVGGLRRNIEASDAAAQGAVESYRDVMVALIAETVSSYLDYRTIQERIRVAQRNIKAQEETLKLTSDRLEAGLTSKIDVAQARTNLESSRALIPQLKGQLARAKNRLAALNGGYSKDAARLLARGGSVPLPRRSAYIGMPAELIRSRPDIRKAERDLAAQTAKIGVAEAELYPKFSLFGTFSLQTISRNEILDSDSRVYSFGPSFKWQVFNAGRIRQTVKVEEIRTEQALLNYEKTVLKGVEEVENSMAGVAHERDRYSSLQRAVGAAKETVELVKGNYKEGLVDFQRVLDTERTLFSSEDSLVSSKGLIAKNYVALYKSLGGGSRVQVGEISAPRIQAEGSLRERQKQREAEAAGVARKKK